MSSGGASINGGGTAFGVTPGEASQVALTEEEQKMVGKLLGDPTYFPIEFRRWLQDFLDNSDFKISQSQIMGGGAGGGSTNPSLLPAGIILPYASTGFGKDCLLCNGQEVSRTDYKELFDAIGLSWGSPSDNTKFKVPDLRDRALYGAGSVVSVGQTDGKSTGNRGGPNHSHSFSGATGGGSPHGHSVSGNTGGMSNSHSHSYTLVGNTTVQQGTAGSYISVSSISYSTPQTGTENQNHTHTFSGSTNNESSHTHNFSGRTAGGYDDKPSFAGVQYAITTGKSQVVTP